MVELPPPEQMLASAVRFLIDGHEEDAASLLLSCTLKRVYVYNEYFNNDEYAAEIVGPREVYEILSDQEHPITAAISKALNAFIPGYDYIGRIFPTVTLVSLDPDWHKELLEIARGQGVHNQIADANEAKLIRIWNNLRFRSASEVHIAEALDRAGVFFLPNCKGRLGLPRKRENKEPDFLVCCDGKWGILEVDGEPFHPPSRTVEDHERDRLFKQHGIHVVEHYDANRCYEHSEEVVENFLKLLKQA